MGSVRILESDVRAQNEDGKEGRAAPSTHVLASRGGPSTSVPLDRGYPNASDDNPRENPPPHKKPSKRRKGEDQERDDEDDGDNQDDRNSTGSSTGKRRLACPFFKRKPTNTRPSCVYPGFSSIARLKEHLYRQHMLPPYKCPRCSTYFMTDLELYDHSRAPDPCQINGANTLEGITPDQEKALKSKKRTNKSGTLNNEEEKWRDIYTILFPLENIPSPYCDTISAPPQYEDFLRREVPSLLRQRLRTTPVQSLRILDEETQMHIVDLVRDCQELLFSRWHPGATEIPNEGVPGVDGNSNPTPAERMEGLQSQKLNLLDDKNNIMEEVEDGAKVEPGSSPPVQNLPEYPADTPLSDVSTITKMGLADREGSQDTISENVVEACSGTPTTRNTLQA